MIGRLIKPCRICLYEQDDGGEVESFCLLRLSMGEVWRILATVSNHSERVSGMLDGSLVIKYSDKDDPTYREWVRIALEHSKTEPRDFHDLSRKYKSVVPGTSVLVRDSRKHTIRIALRKGNDDCTINRLCISNDMRERFFQDVKRGTLFKETGRYIMDSRDQDVYSYWSRFMNNEYLLATKQRMTS